MLTRMRPPSPLLAALVAALGAGCGGGSAPSAPLPPVVGGAARASAASPFGAGCAGPAPSGSRNYPDSVVEPSLAVDPRDPDHLVGIWQQDRWSDGGANGLVAGVSRDGGKTWSRTAVGFSRCAGGHYDRATDPWVSIASDGTVHVLGLAFDATGGRRAILAARSSDGGLTFGDPSPLQADVDVDFGLDKPSLATDPTDSRRVYAVWDRLTGLASPSASAVTGPVWFARSTDGGATWEPARALYDPGQDAQTIGSQVLVQPDGTLANAFVRIVGLSGQSPVNTVAVQRSTDHGTTWSAPVDVATADPVGVALPGSGFPVRSGDVVIAAAVDPASGALYLAWEDGRFSGGQRDGIALSRSTDGGLTWSTPLQVNGAPGAQAFTPALAASAGVVAVTYYDFRLYDPAHPGAQTAAWQATSADGGATWRDAALGSSFDIRGAPDSEGYFLGDYEGLAARGGSFTAFFVMANPAGRGTDVFAEDAAAPWPAAARVAGAAQVNEHPRPLAERLRAPRERPGRR